MKKQCKPLIFTIITIVTLFNLLCYFAIRAMWSGIIRYSFEAMPYILLGTLTATALGTTLCVMNKRFPLILAVWAGLLDVLFLVLDAYIISLTTEATHYFIREFLYGALFLAVIGLVLFLWTVLPKMAIFQKKWVPSVLLCLIFAAGIFRQYDLSLYNSISCTPVVYAVEDTYQIVFTTHAKGTAWVEKEVLENIISPWFSGVEYGSEITIENIK